MGKILILKKQSKWEITENEREMQKQKVIIN